MNSLEPGSPPASFTLGALLRLAWPIVLARATQAVIGFFDAFMVAPLGEDALAAATTGAMNTLSLIILPMGTVFILQSFAAQLRGRGELSSIPRYAWYGLVLAAFFGLVGAASIPAVPWVLGFLDLSRGVHEGMSTYLAIRLLSVAFVVGSEALGNWYGGLGNTRLALIAGVVAMIANVAGNYLLIEPRFGLPGFGIAGAAWASVFASALGFGVLLYAFVRKLGYEPSPFGVRLRAAELVRVLRFGLPNGVNWFLEFAAFALFINVVVARLGTTVLAAFNVVFQINAIAFMPAFGVTSAGAILVGEAIGRGQLGEVWPMVRRTGLVACGWMGSIALVYFFFPEALMGLFESEAGDNRELLTVGATMLSFAAIWQLFDALGLTFGEALRAAGDTAWCMTARIVLAWLVFTPVAWVAVLVLGGGVSTVMISLIVYIGVLAMVLGWRFASGRWRSIQMVGPETNLV